jgi:hypothetical protein
MQTGLGVFVDVCALVLGVREYEWDDDDLSWGTESMHRLMGRNFEQDGKVLHVDLLTRALQDSSTMFQVGHRDTQM